MGIIILISPGWGEEGVWHLANPHSVNGVAITMLLTMLPFKVFFFLNMTGCVKDPQGIGLGGQAERTKNIRVYQNTRHRTKPKNLLKDNFEKKYDCDSLTPMK